MNNETRSFAASRVAIRSNTNPDNIRLNTARNEQNLRQQRDNLNRIRSQKETEAGLNSRRTNVASYISNLFMWNMFLIESNVRHQAQSARERTDKAQKLLMQEVKRVWGRYGRKIDRASTVGSVAIATPGRF